ncbi:MAG: N-acetyltransferase family protein [Acidimicrobiia bacterium]
MRVVRAAEKADAAEIAAIYDPLVLESHVSFEIEPPGPEEMGRRLDVGSKTHPWVVMVDGPDLIGYAYAGRHRSRPGYTWSVETSVYVAPRSRGQGVGKELYSSLTRQCREWGYVSAFAGIALPNAASERLHESSGFVQIAVFPRVGFKAGRWWDVGWWYLSLSDESSASPAPPGPPTILHR